jgi:hypothetical protein
MREGDEGLRWRGWVRADRERKEGEIRRSVWQSIQPYPSNCIDTDTVYARYCIKKRHSTI